MWKGKNKRALLSPDHGAWIPRLVSSGSERRMSDDKRRILEIY